MIERIENVAIILYASHYGNGIEFLTPNEYPQQLAYMNRPKGYRIKAHYHNPIQRHLTLTQEVLFIKSGCVRVSLYDEHHDRIAGRLLHAGDVILLAAGGHGFEFLEDSEIVEAKTGPYMGESEKGWI